MFDKKTLLIIGAVAVVAALIVLYHKNTKEGYLSNPLSAIGEMKRTPVTYAFRGDGMTENPHWKADPSDRNVPLEYGGQDFWNPNPHVMPPPLTRADGLANDSKLRKDMVDSGDIFWHRYLNNIPVSNFQPNDGRHFESDDVYVDFREEPLYHPSYHYDDVLGN